MATENVQAALFALEKDGRLAPAAVVEAARDPASPLHDSFEWDDTEAARKYRLAQASLLIARLRVDVTVHSIPLRAPAYVRDRGARTGFRSLVSVRNEADVSRSVLVDEMARVSNAIRRAKTVAAALGFVEEIEQIDALAASVTGRVAQLGDEARGTA